MNRYFFPKLAIEGIRKNYRMYKPYIFTSILMVMMFYILSFLSYDENLLLIRGGDFAMLIMRLGSIVMCVFSALFMFYTNAFLIRRRKKEFGLYNVLGMNKRNIGKILFWENLMVLGISLVFGIISGIALSKLAEIGLAKTIKGAATYAFKVPLGALEYTVLYFVIIFILLFLNSVRQVRFSNPTELIRSENTGEKAPKVNWLIGTAGILVLAAAYYLAVSISDPVEAILFFFIAVIMVIIGTYLVFISGSVMICRILQKNKHYYYQKSHFISVSSMAYRMKRNGAGLASICILLTMILVMVSSTTSLYIGIEDTVNTIFPSDVSIYVTKTNYSESDAEFCSKLIETARESFEVHNIAVTEDSTNLVYNCAGYLENKCFLVTPSEEFVHSQILNASEKTYYLRFISVAEYNRIYGQNLMLDNNEIAASVNGVIEEGDIVYIGEHEFTIKSGLCESSQKDQSVSIVNNAFIVVSDINIIGRYFKDTLTYNGEPLLTADFTVNFNVGNETVFEDLKEAVSDAANQIYRLIQEYGIEDECSYSTSIKEEQRIDYLGSCGALFFLGLMLSAVFMTAAVIIIYYKQLSEGYEDQNRFEIMQNVGMTKPDIKKSINSQMFIVFFMPILFAVMHISFAFPVIRKLLMLFNLYNTKLIILCTGVSVLALCVLYCYTYIRTSKTYYSIVSGNIKKCK